MNEFVLKEFCITMHHKDLDAWKKSIELVKDVYSITSEFPDAELYGLVSQMRRSAISIPSNLAEGSAKFSDNETLRFIDISIGSLAELETQVIIAKELNFIKDNIEILEKIKQLNAMYIGLRKYLRTKSD